MKKIGVFRQENGSAVREEGTKRWRGNEADRSRQQDHGRHTYVCRRNIPGKGMCKLVRGPREQGV